MKKVLTARKIDVSAVGDALGYKNVKSVSNRISAMKKKYNLPFGSGTSRGGTSSTSPEPKVPTTPAKNRVTKSGAASAKKTASAKALKTATGKGKAAKEKAEDTEDADGIEGDDEMSEITLSQAKKDTGDKDNTDDNDEEFVVEA